MIERTIARILVLYWYDPQTGEVISAATPADLAEVGYVPVAELHDATASADKACQAPHPTRERDDAREMTHAALDDIGAPGDRSVPPWERIGRIAPLGQESTT